MCERDYVWKYSTCVWEIVKCLKRITGDSELTCDETIDAVAKLKQSWTIHQISMDVKSPAK